MKTSSETDLSIRKLQQTPLGIYNLYTYNKR